MIIIPQIVGKLDQATKDWLAQTSTKPNYNVVNAINTFIIQCKIDGNWSLFDRVWLYAQDVQANAKISLAKPTSTQITEVNSPSWVANRGYTSNGTSSYLNLNFTPSTDAVNYTLNSASYGSYYRNNIDELKVSGVADGTKWMTLIARSSNTIFFDANANGEATATNNNSSALISVQRVNSTNVQAFRNGVSLGNPAWASTALPTRTAYSLCFNNAGTASLFETKQKAFEFIGGGGIDHLKLYNAVQNLGTALGWQV